MVIALEQGLPIPSIISNTDSAYDERPAYVQEILSAAWIYRANGFKNSILRFFSELNIHRNSEEINALMIEFDDRIIKKFRRFDESVLKSIQVSEWFDLFAKDSPDRSYFAKLSSVKGIPGIGQLVDGQIYKLIKRRQLIIVPIMSIQDQLGSTSIDIRLGTSFQVFMPNSKALILKGKPEFMNKLDSSLIDLDWKQSIIIAPGQFLLGHSMEYIRLPRNLSADLEGRSSFARLGLQIHMTAGFVEPGYDGVLTFEIYNAGSSPIELFPGIRIAQLRFNKIATPRKTYKAKESAKYNSLLVHNPSLFFQDYEYQQLDINSTKD